MLDRGNQTPRNLESLRVRSGIRKSGRSSYHVFDHCDGLSGRAMGHLARVQANRSDRPARARRGMRPRGPQRVALQRNERRPDHRFAEFRAGHPQFSTPLLRGVYKDDGTVLNARAARQADGKVAVGTANGPEKRDVGGIGGASISIDRPENLNYRMSIEYPFILTRPTIAVDDRFAGLSGTGIQGVARVSYFVDSSEADHGRLSVIEDGPATITWEGHMSP